MQATGTTLADALSHLDLNQQPEGEYSEVHVIVSVYVRRVCPKCGAIRNTGMGKPSLNHCIDCEDRKRYRDEERQKKLRAKASLQVEF